MGSVLSSRSCAPSSSGPRSRPLRQYPGVRLLPRRRWPDRRSLGHRLPRAPSRTAPVTHVESAATAAAADEGQSRRRDFGQPLLLRGKSGSGEEAGAPLLLRTSCGRRRRRREQVRFARRNRQPRAAPLRRPELVRSDSPRRSLRHDCFVAGVVAHRLAASGAARQRSSITSAPRSVSDEARRRAEFLPRTTHDGAP
jgi:hypothetical protein